MVSVNNVKAFCKAYGAKSILNTKPQKIHGANPSLTYMPSGKSFDLPRFSSVEMQMARVMNKIAIRNDYITRSKTVLTSPKVLPEDLKRLESMTLEDSYKRAFWINPKDNKAYHLLDEGRTKDGMQKLRILNEQGEFVKNAEIKPKTVILTDLTEAADFFPVTGADGEALSHTDIINIVARRYNPFAKYKNIRCKKGNESEYYKKLSNTIDKDTSCVSQSFANMGTCTDPIRGKGKEIQEECLKYIIDNRPEVYKEICNLKKIVPKTRVLVGVGNQTNNSINSFLLPNSIEGVGGLNLSGKIHTNSSSRNSMFAQHYEPYNFPIMVTKGGINMTGLRGTDYPLFVWKSIGTHLGTIGGTSYSTPIRAAKLALNEMMEGVL